MDNWAAIKYRDFWDVPRIFLVPHRGTLFLFDCAFDEEKEDYPDSYHVYILPTPSEEELIGSWDKLHLRASKCLGEVPVAEVRFDPTRRRAVDSALLDQLLARDSTRERAG